MRIRPVVTTLVALVLAVGLAPSLSAQSPTDRTLFTGVSFKADAATVKANASPIAFRMAAPAPAPRQAGSATWTPMVLGGFSNTYGFGLAVGGGVQASNFMDREEFGLQIDGLFSLADACAGAFGVDCSANAISIAGAFLYKFPEMSSGWRPFAGGGLVFTRFSFSYDDNFVCDVVVDCSASTSTVGVQIQGGIGKGNLHLEGRVQGTAGGSFMGLVGYKFGGS